MEFAVMSSAERHCELVAHFAPERRRLSKPEMMCVSRSAATNEAWLSTDKLDVHSVAQPAGLPDREGTLVDADLFRTCRTGAHRFRKLF
jgi:hypothetical protein